MSTPRNPQADCSHELIRTGSSVEALKRAYLDNLFYMQGRFRDVATPHDLYMAAAYMVRDRVLDRWIKTARLELAIENEIDRFSLAIDVIDRVPRLQVAGAHVKEKLRDMQIECRNYAHEHGVDQPEARDWTWPYK